MGEYTLPSITFLTSLRGRGRVGDVEKEGQWLIELTEGDIYIAGKGRGGIGGWTTCRCCLLLWATNNPLRSLTGAIMDIWSFCGV